MNVEIMSVDIDKDCYRWKILRKLRERNEDEKSFLSVIYLCNTLFDAVDFLKKENLKLRVHNIKLEQENLELDLRREINTPSSPEQVLLLEKKLFQLQEELTELHRKKSEFAQQIIDLRNSLDKKDKELAAKCTQLHDMEVALNQSEEITRKFQQKVSESETNLQLIKDEYDALLLAYSNLEEKKLKLEKDHRDVIKTWLDFKARDADRLNAETEKIQKAKQEKLKKDLEEAAREPVVIDPKRNRVSCIEALIPRKIGFKFDAHDAEVNAAIWFSCGTRIVTGGGDRKIKLWEITPGCHPVMKGVAHESNSSVMSVDFDSEEHFVLGASCDFASRVWTVSDLKIRHTLTGHSGKVMAAKFLGESSRVVSGSHDRTLKIWDLRKRACIRTIFAGSSCNDVIPCDSLGNNLVSGHCDKRIRFWDMRTDTSQNEIFLQGKITSLDISLDGYSLLSCARDDSLKLIDLRMHRVTRTYSADGFVVAFDWTRAKLSPDGRYCIAGSHDGSIFIWAILSGKVEKTLKWHNNAVITCCWSPNGQAFVSCDRNKKAILWSNF